MRCLVMDEPTAISVTGTFNGKSIEPIKQENGTYLLHCDNMNDPDFSSIVPILLLCEVIDV